MFKHKWIVVLAAVLLTVAFSLGAHAQQSATVYAVTTGNRVVSFDAAVPGTLLSDVTITGLGDGETIVGIDIRPATGQLFVLTSGSRLYILDPMTGSIGAAGGAFSPGLNGSNFGMDFNPTVDRIRVTSDAGQNIRLNPNNGGLAGTDTVLTYNGTDVNAGATPAVVASAYTNNFSGASTTVLYNIDASLDILVTQIPPNNGTLNTVGRLGIDATSQTSFDIMSDRLGSDAGFAAVGSSFYGINLANGAASFIGSIPVAVRHIAVTNSVRPQAATPLCTDFNGSTNAIVRAGLPGNTTGGVFCRVLAENGVLLAGAGPQIGVQSVLDRGVIQAVEIFAPYGSTSLDGGARICLLGTGTFIFLNAAQSPRQPVEIATTMEDGYTCGGVNNTGTAVLVRN
jgi:hypothetical protein